MSRHSITNTLRLARGARNAIARTGIRYAKRDVIALLLRRALKAVNAAEAELRAAHQVALERQRAEDRRAA